MRSFFTTRAKLLYALLAVSIFSISSLHALDLETAKQQGLVGEGRDGYLGVVSNSAEVESLVKDINQKRREMYKKISSSNGTSLKQVESLAAQKAIDKTAKGYYVQDASGSWIKK